MSDANLAVRVRQMRWEADTVLSLELESADGTPLPDYTPGAHIDLHLAEGLSRSYSLLAPWHDGGGYTVAVHRAPDSHGGSRHVHEVLRPGQRLTISPPSNHFPLVEDAGQTVLIAGGIGITPLLCMARRLAGLGRDWQLHYAARSRSAAAFVDDLAALNNERVHCHFDDEHHGAPIDLGAVVSGAPDAHFYCCGPAPMLEAYRAATADLPAERVHLEYFSGSGGQARDGGFEVVLERSGLTLAVPEGRTILDALLDNGITVPFSCSEGICGTCETRVLAGEPDHRDLILSEEEKAAGDTIMVCCSGARSKRLVLDL